MKEKISTFQNNSGLKKLTLFHRGTCLEEGDTVCIDCFTIGVCVNGSDGTLAPVENSGCLTDRVSFEYNITHQNQQEHLQLSLKIRTGADIHLSLMSRHLLILNIVVI